MQPVSNFPYVYKLLNQRLMAFLGVYAQERLKKQEIWLDVTIYSMNEIDLLVKNNLFNTVEQYFLFNQPKLLEKIALDLADTLLKSYVNIDAIELTIKKPNAISNALYSFVSISLKR